MKLFISYARLNRKQVEELQDVLRRAGHNTWRDEQLVAGDDWWQTILSSIENCDIFIFALTPESTNSEACRAEYQYAVTLNKPIFPILIKDAELPIGSLAETHYVVAKNLNNTNTILDISRALVNFQEKIDKGEFLAPEPNPPRPPYPFPPDPLTEVREKIGNLSNLSEENLLGIVYRIKQVSHSSEKISVESRTLLEKIAANPSVPYGIVQEARTALKEIPEAGQSNMMRYSVGIAAIIIIVVIGFFALQSMGIFGTTATDEPTGEVIATDEPTQIPTATDEPTNTPTDEPTATDEPTEEVTEENSRVITVENASEVVQLGDPLRSHTSSIRTLAFSTDSTMLVSGSSDFSFRVWDVETRRAIHANTTTHKAWVNSVAFSPDGRLLATADFNGFVYLWDTSNWSRVANIDPDSMGYWDRVPTTWDLAFSPDSQSIAIAFDINTIEIWDSRLETKELTIPEGARSIAFSPDGTRLVSGDSAGIVRIWETTTGNLLQEYLSHTDQVNSVAFNHDGMQLASGGADGFINIWDIETQQSLITLSQSDISEIVFNIDSTLIISASTDKSVRLWDIATGDNVQILREHTGQVFSVAISPDGSMIASGGSSLDRTIRFWGLPQD